jgi:methyl-accepting chemotaxis protein
MDDLSSRTLILEHRMDTAEQNSRRLEEVMTRTREEIRETVLRIEARMDQMNHRIDQMSHQLLELSAEIRRTQRWILAAVAFMTTVITILLPVSWHLAERWL